MLTLISQMETRPQHRRLVDGTRPATTLSPVAYITTDFIGCAEIKGGQVICEICGICVKPRRRAENAHADSTDGGQHYLPNSNCSHFRPLSV